jgi:pimeloyl-ACP methyl ester carboxylesterase
MVTDGPSPDTIVLVHGLWLTARSWERWIERYESRGYRVLAPNWPGMEGEVEALNADPSPIEELSVERIVDHYESIIIDLERPPIIMGHSFGGTFTQILLDRGLGAVGVGVASATVKGVRDLPLSTIKVAAPGLKPGSNGAVPLTAKEFHYAFANTLGEDESDALFTRYCVPTAGTVLKEYAFANFHRDAPTKVEFAREDRAPLLFIGFGEDHVMPPKVVHHNEERYDDAASLTEYKEFPGRPHFPAVPGWEEVADYALSWAVANAVTRKGERAPRV